MNNYKFLFTAIVLSLFSLKTLSQDVILLKDGNEIKSKVIEITEDVIKYKKFEHLDGPLISISKNKIFMITYENGTKEVISTVEIDSKEEIKPKEDTKKSETVTVTYSKVGFTSTQKEKSFINLIKINPLLIINGDIPIYFEHIVSEHLTIEGGIGITQYDYLYYSLHPEYSLTSEITRTANIGVSIRASVRFYPSSYIKPLEDYYIGPEIRFKYYNTEVTCGSKITPHSERRTHIDFKISGGYIYYISDRVAIDIYGGIGLRKIMLTRVYCTDDQGNLANDGYPETKDNLAPVIALGFKIGFGF